MLPSLKYRRMRGDMIQMYKIIHGIDDLDWKDFLEKLKQIEQDIPNINCM